MRCLIIVAVLAGGSTLFAEQAQPRDRNLHVGLFGYRPDGTVSAHAVQTRLERRSFVWVLGSGCGIGSGPDTDHQQPLYAWSLSGKVLDLTVEAAVIQLDWQRVTDNGRPAAGPGGSVQLTLHAGDRVLLDSVVPHTSGAPCWSRIGFEARYRADPNFFADVQVTRRPRGEGDTSTARPDRNAPSDGSAGSGGSVRSADTAAPDAAISTSRYNVHLWLVRSAPGRPEESQYRQVSVAGSRTPFAFAPLSVTMTQAATSVTVGGSLEARTGTGSGDHLLLVMHRNVPQPDGGRIYSESQMKVLPMPDKVLSFDMPPVQVDDQLLPDRLSLRVRVEPR